MILYDGGGGEGQMMKLSTLLANAIPPVQCPNSGSRKARPEFPFSPFHLSSSVIIFFFLYIFKKKKGLVCGYDE